MNRTVLRELLGAHFPSDERESDHLESMLALLELPGDVFSRAHCTPGHFTASAFVVSPDRAAVALVHHAKLNRWVQPGGHIEAGDADIFSAAAREVAEEIGVTALSPLGPGTVFDVDVHDIPGRPGEPAHRHYDVRVAFRARTEALRAGDGVSEARWVPLGDVAAIGTDESVLRAIRKLTTP